MGTAHWLREFGVISLYELCIRQSEENSHQGSLGVQCFLLVTWGTQVLASAKALISACGRIYLLKVNFALRMEEQEKVALWKALWDE